MFWQPSDPNPYLFTSEWSWLPNRRHAHHHNCKATRQQALEFIVTHDQCRRRLHQKILQPMALHPKPNHIQYFPIQRLITLSHLLENPPGLRGRRACIQQPSQHLLQDMRSFPEMLSSPLVPIKHVKTDFMSPNPDKTPWFRWVTYNSSSNNLNILYHIAERKVPDDADDFCMVYHSQAWLEFCELDFEIILPCTADVEKVW